MWQEIALFRISPRII